LNEWNEWIDLLSNEGLFVMIIHEEWNYERVVNNEFWMINHKNIIKVKSEYVSYERLECFNMFEWAMRTC